MRKVIAFVLIANLFGCAVDPYSATIPPHRQAEYRTELNQCDYEARLHVREPQAVSKYSIMADYDMSEQRKSLVLACMKNKGWNYSR